MNKAARRYLFPALVKVWVDEWSSPAHWVADPIWPVPPNGALQMADMDLDIALDQSGGVGATALGV